MLVNFLTIRLAKDISEKTSPRRISQLSLRSYSYA